MDIINYKDFSSLRLEDYISNNQDISSVEDFEFMDAIWSGNCVGFTEWLQLDNDPKTKSISLDLNDLTDSEITEIFLSIKLNLAKGITKELITERFGQPFKIENFVADRVTYEYVVGSTEKYYLSLTIQNENGLIYVVLTNHADGIKTLEKNASA